YGINPQRTQRYISHANQFIVLANGKRLADHNAADIETYLSDKSRDPDTSDSCFREIALALKILFVEKKRGQVSISAILFNHYIKFSHNRLKQESKHKASLNKCPDSYSPAFDRRKTIHFNLFL
ncbi:hypothetical protein MNBD_GAMMA09-38, partial [hydrothermal vent metagenome]